MPETTARRYGGQSAGERDADRRSRLLAATREIMGQDGYAATTVEKICSRAGVSSRHFYQQYQTKEDALADLYDTLTETFYAAVAQSLRVTEGRSMSERVQAAVRAYVGPLLADIRLARIMFVEVTGASPRLEAKRLEFRAALVGFVVHECDQAVARGEIADRDFHFAALALFGATAATIYDWMGATARPREEQLADALATLAVTLLTA